MEAGEKKIVVHKYGGSSVADVEKLKLVARRIASTVGQGFRVVVVVSAMGKTTDELYRLARSMSPAPPRRELDMLLSTGERISMALLAMALAELDIDAISFTGSQSGILTNDRHSGARIIEVRPVRIQDELARDRVVIVAGFQGMSYKREITTLGRGGSDTTAVALAAALGAETCEIYSDVDGVYSADPRVVPEARHLGEVSYDEMQELAEHGARVLNAQAVEWARRQRIVIHARRTQGSARETRIVEMVPSLSSEGPAAKAVTGTEQVHIIRAGEKGPQVLAIIGGEGLCARHVRLQGHGQETRLSAALVLDDVPDWPKIRDRLAALSPRIEVDESLGMVTAVGTGLGARLGAVSAALARLVEAGIEAREVDIAPLRLSVLLPSAQVRTATALLHTALCT